MRPTESRTPLLIRLLVLAVPTLLFLGYALPGVANLVGEPPQGDDAPADVLFIQNQLDVWQSRCSLSETGDATVSVDELKQMRRWMMSVQRQMDTLLVTRGERDTSGRRHPVPTHEVILAVPAP
jgi:hypothetical protein